MTHDSAICHMTVKLHTEVTYDHEITLHTLHTITHDNQVTFHTLHTCTCVAMYVFSHPGQFPLQMLHPQNPPNPEPQIPRYKFELSQNLNLNREIPRNLSFLIWRILGVEQI